MAEFAKVATAAEVPPGQAKLVEAGGKRIALFNVVGAYYAIDDTCPHSSATRCATWWQELRQGRKSH